MSDEIKLTEPQRRALEYLNSVTNATPSRIGEAMYHEGWRRRERHLSAQGCGRVGGTMATRLVKMGLVRDLAMKNDGWSLYEISQRGRELIWRLRSKQKS
jgi:hypothetical protein